MTESVVSEWAKSTPLKKVSFNKSQNTKLHQKAHPPQKQHQSKKARFSYLLFCGKTLNSSQAPGPIQRRFKSARLVGLYEKPWLHDRSYRTRERFDKIILGVCAFIGLAIAGLICWIEWNKLPVYQVRTICCTKGIEPFLNCRTVLFDPRRQVCIN